ncbi:MAG: ATP-binding protein [Solirubrobacteraceae bacterium]
MARARPRRGALGLRGRIVGAVLVTTVATLAVAAVALLGPLEQSLRNSALTTLKHDLPNHPTQDFENLDLQALTNALQNPAISSPAQTALQNTQQKLVSRLGGGFVYVLGYPNADGQGQLLLPPASEGENAESDSFDDVAKSFQTAASNTSFGTIGNKDYVRMTFPFTNDKVNYVLAVRRPIDEIPGAVRTVKNAFITAALAGLALTLILAIPLAMTVVRRLRHLRQAALRLAQEGPTAPVPEDRARDEVGDLARTFAIMQRRLQHQEEARRAFVATASHELRTPLTSLDGMLELIDDDLGGGEPDLEDARALLERARAQSRRLGRLAADLLDLSRIDAEVQLRSEPVELGELSRAVLAEFELGIGERGIVSALDDGIGPVWALGDPGSVARILRILLDNAVRVSPAGGELRVELRHDPVPTLSVIDQGPGVPPEERDLIFERFKRGRDTGGQAGFGLGLAIGRELAARMGGELVLEQQDGAGARFTLHLPAARAPEGDAVAFV